MVCRVMQQLRNDCQTDLQRYELLAQLQASNENLYYTVLMKHIKELAPIAYTPTVGKACQDFDRIYRCACTHTPPFSSPLRAR